MKNVRQAGLRVFLRLRTWEATVMLSFVSKTLCHQNNSQVPFINTVRAFYDSYGVCMDAHTYRTDLGFPFIICLAGQMLFSFLLPILSFDACCGRSAPLFFLRFPQLESLRPISKPDVEKRKTATYRMKNPTACARYTARIT